MAKKSVSSKTKKVAHSKSKRAGSFVSIITADKRLLIATLAALVALIAVGAIAFWPNAKNQSQSTIQNSNVVAPEDECEDETKAKFTCYKNQLVKITNEQNPITAFALVKAQYDKVGYVKSQCHQLSHVIGRAGYEKYRNLSDTFANGDKFCWSGYYHGAIEQLIKNKGYNNVLKDADSVCAPIAKKEKYSFYHYNCVHGLGHGFMFVQDGKLFDSLTACDSLTDSWERVSCYGGAFMQNIMNSQGPDADPKNPNIYLRSTEPMYPCTAVDSKYKNQCYLMQTSHALSLVGYDFKKVFEECAKVEEQFRSTCYTSLGRDASGNSISDVDQTRTSCLLGPDDEAKRHCILGAASDFVSYFHSDQQALKLCASLPELFKIECRVSVERYYSTF